MKNRPTYKIWDKQYNQFYEPIYEAYRGRLEDLTLTPSGELIMRKMNENGEVETIHESRFPNRFNVYWEEEEGTSFIPNNQDNTINFQGTINYQIK
jgi:hypothetical protein